MALVSLDGRFLKVNRLLCSITGYSDEALLNLTFQDITHPDDLEIDLSYVNELIEGKREAYQLEKRCFHKDGHIITILLTSSIVSTDDMNSSFFIVQVQDITDKKRLEEKMLLCTKVIETTQQGIVITDDKANIIMVNKGFKQITGFSENEVLGHNPRLWKSGKHDQSFYQHMWSQLLTCGQWQGEIWNRNKNGVIFPQWLNISAVKNTSGNVTHYVSVFSDISKLKEAENKLKEINVHLKKLSSIDSLTGISNRRMFDQALHREWHRAIRYQHPLSLIMLDIDYFKKFNDTYGHLQGDECLKQVAKNVVQSVNRSTDLVSRYGGEEFSIILPDTNREAAIIIAERIRKNIEQLGIPHIRSEIGDYLTISLGVASLIPSTVSSPIQLIKLADKMLYSAKHNGRNCVAVH